MQSILALEDGRIFRGLGYGSPGECQGEVVFNTSLTGYQEIATDPSYAGQIVVLTTRRSDYGTNQADNEAAKPYIEGLIVREFRLSAPTGARSRSRTSTWSGIPCRYSPRSIRARWFATSGHTA